jgi:hypothetical protein
VDYLEFSPPIALWGGEGDGEGSGILKCYDADRGIPPPLPLPPAYTTHVLLHHSEGLLLMTFPKATVEWAAGVQTYLRRKFLKVGLIVVVLSVGFRLLRLKVGQNAVSEHAPLLPSALPSPPPFPPCPNPRRLHPVAIPPWLG